MASEKKGKFASARTIAYKWFLRPAFIASIGAGAVYASSAVLADEGWIYQVPERYGAVVTKWDGRRVAQIESGWYQRVPFLSRHEGYHALAKQAIFLNGNPDPHRVYAKDKKLIESAAMTVYSITDLKRYAIDTLIEDEQESGILSRSTESIGGSRGGKLTVTPKLIIQKTLDTIIGSYMRNTARERIMNETEAVQKEIKKLILSTDIQEKYGIKIEEFSLTNAKLIQEEETANANKLALIARSEGEAEAALKEKEARETLADAEMAVYKKYADEMKPRNAKEREHVREVYRENFKMRILEKRSGDTVWVVEGDTKPMFQPRSLPRR